MSITKYVREVQIQRENQLDNWHTLKQLETALKGISTESKKYHRVKWHYEFEEKLHAVRTHAYHSLINCEQDPHKLRAILINCAQHYRAIPRAAADGRMTMNLLIRCYKRIFQSAC